LLQHLVSLTENFPRIVYSCLTGERVFAYVKRTIMTAGKRYHSCLDYGSRLHRVNDRNRFGHKKKSE